MCSKDSTQSSPSWLVLFLYLLEVFYFRTQICTPLRGTHFLYPCTNSVPNVHSRHSSPPADGIHSVDQMEYVRRYGPGAIKAIKERERKHAETTQNITFQILCALENPHRHSDLKVVKYEVRAFHSTKL
jgi:hypothetical protein